MPIMNHSKLYVPNAQKLVQFFTSKRKFNQTGGGSLQQKILPIQKYIPENKHSDIIIKSVSPVEQTVQQVVSDLKREHIKPSSTMKRHHSKRKYKSGKKQKRKTLKRVKKKSVNRKIKKRKVKRKNCKLQ